MQVLRPDVPTMPWGNDWQRQQSKGELPVSASFSEKGRVAVTGALRLWKWLKNPKRNDPIDREAGFSLDSAGVLKKKGVSLWIC